MSVYDIANRLARELKRSDQYKDYKEVREKILSDKRKLDMLQDYQQLQMKLQSKQLAGEDLTEKDKEEFQKIQDIVQLNADVQKYLESEYQIGVVLNDIQRIIFSDLEIGINVEEEKEKE